MALDTDRRTNVLLVGFTGVLALVGFLQLLLLRQNARTTRRLERAWVLIEPFGRPNDLEVGLALEVVHKVITYKITNYGRSPAWVTSLSAKCELFTDPAPGPPRKLTFSAEQSLSGLWLPLPPQRPDRNSVAVAANPVEREAIERWRATYIFTAMLRYRDAFGRAHKTTVYRSYRPSPVGGAWQAGPKRYNRCT